MKKLEELREKIYHEHLKRPLSPIQSLNSLQSRVNGLKLLSEKQDPGANPESQINELVKVIQRGLNLEGGLDSS